jgi:hypothetical protein
MEWRKGIFVARTLASERFLKHPLGISFTPMIWDRPEVAPPSVYGLVYVVLKRKADR